MRGRLLVALALVLALGASSASAATRPSLAVVGLKSGPIAGRTLPYVEVGSQVELSGSYRGSLHAGARLGLLVKAPDSSFKLSKAAIHLSGGHAKVKVTFDDVGGPVEYKLAVVSHGRQLAVSRPVTVYYAQLPGGVFAELQGSYASFTSTTKASESCAAPSASTPLCKADASGGQTLTVAGFSGNFPVPPGWKVTLTFNGGPVCSSESIEARCEGSVTFPEVSSPTVVDLTATLISPHGQDTVATRAITVYPG